MPKMTFDEALDRLTQIDATFLPEVRKRLAPVKDRFFAQPGRDISQPEVGLRTPPAYLSDPELRKVAIGLAELALDRGIDINVTSADDGSTFLHFCALLRDSATAVYAVEWLLAHGADPYQKRNDGETPLSLAVKFDRTEVADVMRSHGGYGGRD